MNRLKPMGSKVKLFAEGKACQAVHKILSGKAGNSGVEIEFQVYPELSNFYLKVRV